MTVDLALCVGINDYPGTGADLSGCVNDALDMEAFLTGRGATVTAMHNAAATRGAFLSALEAIVAATGYRQTSVVSVSSHGTWKPASAGGDFEVDGRDEALVMADFGLVTDDEIAAAYARRRWGSRHIFVADACHTGSVSRVVDLGPNPPTGRKAKFLPPGSLLDVEQLRVAERVAAQPARSLLRSSDVLLLSACRDYEVAWDAWFGTRPNGAFTRSLLNTVAQLPAGVEYRDVMSEVPLPTDEFPQTPGLSGSYTQSRWPAFA